MSHSSPTNASSLWLREAIEQVTDPTQSKDDWALIMEICDEVAIHKRSATEAMEEIRERLQMKPVSEGWRSIALTLTLLEALVKNCGKIFHIHLANKDFLRALKSIIAPKNNPPLPIEEQILGMIQYWTVVFCDEPDLEPIRQLYEICQLQGFKFPPADEQHLIKASLPTTAMSKHSTSAPKPIAPAKTTTRPKTSIGSYGRNNSIDRNSHQFNKNSSTVIRHLSDEQIAKLRSELDLVHINLDIFEEMLSILHPGHEHPDDWKLFTDLYETGKHMQARIVSLLALVAIDDVAVDLLRCNDRLNIAFNNYGWYMEKRERGFQPSVPYAEIMEHDRKSSSYERKVNNDDCDSDEFDNQLMTSSTGRRSIPTSTHRFSTEEHDDRSSLPTKLQNMRLTPLPDPVPRSTIQTAVFSTKRAQSATGLVGILRNKNKKAQVINDNDENMDSDENIQSINRKERRDDVETPTAVSKKPSRVKRLSTYSDEPVDGGYKVTGYHRLEPDSKK